MTTAAVLAQGGAIEPRHLPDEVARGAGRDGGDSGDEGRGRARATAQGEGDAGGEGDARRAELAALLVEHRGNVTAVARAMGKARMQIQRWLKRYRIDPEQFRR